MGRTAYLLSYTMLCTSAPIPGQSTCALPLCAAQSPVACNLRTGALTDHAQAWGLGGFSSGEGHESLALMSVRVCVPQDLAEFLRQNRVQSGGVAAVLLARNVSKQVPPPDHHAPLPFGILFSFYVFVRDEKCIQPFSGPAASDSCKPRPKDVSSPIWHSVLAGTLSVRHCPWFTSSVLLALHPAQASASRCCGQRGMGVFQAEH